MADDGSEFPDWEEKNIGDIGEVITGSTPSTKHDGYFGDEILWATPVDLNDQLVLKNTTRKLSKLGYSKVRKLPEGSVLVSCIASIGKVGVLPVSGSCNQQINAVIPEPDIDSLWLGYAMLPKKPTLEMLGGNGGLKIVNKTLFENMHIFVPSLPEQKKIAACLSSADETIALCQRKVDLLTQAKKALMQQIFSQKLRFKADDGSEFPAWEEETVGDLFVFVSSKNTGNTIDNVITNSAEFGLIPQRDFFDKDIAVEGRTENYTIIHKGDFVYNPRKSTTAPYGPFNIYSREEVGIVSPLYTCLTPINSDSSDYLAWYFQTDRWFSYIVKNGAQGGARHDRVGMTNELMKKIPVQVPSLPEQQKISSVLSSFDSLITQARAELKQWKLVKKSLLQQMFV